MLLPKKKLLISRRSLLIAAPAILISNKVADAQFGGCSPAFCSSSQVPALCAPPYATWDPVTAHNVALTGGNLTATNTSPGFSIDQGARIITSRSSGKYYHEIHTGTGGAFREGNGIVNPATAYGTFSGNGGGGVWWDGFGSTNVFSNGVFQGTSGATAANPLCWATDLDNRLIWVRNPGGNWNNNALADPATAVGGYTIMPALAMGPCCTFGGFGATPGRITTANFGSTAFADTPPVGFCGWHL